MLVAVGTVMVCGTPAAVNERVMVGAASYVRLPIVPPGWSAVIVHVPTVIIWTSPLLATLQMLGVVEV